jgi:hemolysin III
MAGAVYVASMLILFGTSATYHRGRWTERWRSRMQRLDHAMIFVLIAGSFTPLTLLSLGAAWGVVFLVVAWTFAAIGIGLSLLRFDLIDRHEGLFYVGFGWLLVLALPGALSALSALELVCLFAGGVLYTIGAIGFSMERPDPRPAVFGYHEVWHVMTVAAAGCHYVFVLQLVRT